MINLLKKRLDETYLKKILRVNFLALTSLFLLYCIFIFMTEDKSYETHATYEVQKETISQNVPYDATVAWQFYAKAKNISTNETVWIKLNRRHLDDKYITVATTHLSKYWFFCYVGLTCLVVIGIVLFGYLINFLLWLFENDESTKKGV